jgi:hypothetical protein
MRKQRWLSAMLLLLGASMSPVPGGRTRAQEAEDGGLKAAVVRPDGTVWLWSEKDGSDSLSAISGVSNATSAALSSSGVVLVRGGELWRKSRDTGALTRLSEERTRTVACWRDRCAATTGDDHVIQWTGDARPALVPALEDVAAVSVGERHSLALTHSGLVFAWGADDRGQLGFEGDDTAEPVLVEHLGGSAIHVAAGSDTSVAVLADGTVRAWGASDHGQTGIGSFTDTSVPTVVVGMEGVIRTASAGRRTVFLRNDGELWVAGEGRDRPERIDSPGDRLGVEVVDDTTVAYGGDGGLWASSPGGTKEVHGEAAEIHASEREAGVEGEGRAVLLVGEGGASASDDAVRGRLEQLGFSVAVLSASEADVDSAAGASVVLAPRAS